MALATTISGGTFLGVDLSTEHLKAAVRNGSCDFMVNTLDESLRVLKNELRKKKALSVGLLGEATAILPAMVERGVQPDLVTDSSASNNETPLPCQASLQEFIERGAILVDPNATRDSHADEFLEVIWTASTIADLRQMDDLALQQLPVGDSIRRRWLQHAPVILPSPATFAAHSRDAPWRSGATWRSNSRRQFWLGRFNLLRPCSSKLKKAPMQVDRTVARGLKIIGR